MKRTMRTTCYVRAQQVSTRPTGELTACLRETINLNVAVPLQCGYIPLADRYGIYLFTVRRRVKASSLLCNCVRVPRAVSRL